MTQGIVINDFIFLEADADKYPMIVVDIDRDKDIITFK
jgi:hypothetical protein